jgi:hypothetical protein
MLNDEDVGARSRKDKNKEVNTIDLKELLRGKRTESDEMEQLSEKGGLINTL